jgi:hypothetical protein
MIGNQTIILELTTSHLKLIGQLLHIHLVSNADQQNPIGEDLLYELLNQTDNIYKEPEKHSVYPTNGTEHPYDAYLTAPVWIKRVEGYV